MQVYELLVYVNKFATGIDHLEDLPNVNVTD